MNPSRPILRLAAGVACAALVPAAGALAAKPATTASRGATATATATTTLPAASVRKLQRDLRKLGYFKGPLSGLYGPITKAAVAAFQQANGLTADGVAGPLTQAAIAARLAGRPVPASAQPAPAATAAGPLSVKELQTDLSMLSFYNSAIDGVMGPATKAALEQLQATAGLTPDGVLGPATKAAIAHLLKTRG